MIQFRSVTKKYKNEHYALKNIILKLSTIFIYKKYPKVPNLLKL